jgi:hypothetical protein
MGDSLPRSPVPLRLETGRVNWQGEVRKTRSNFMLRVLVIAACAALQSGCGLGETGSAAASGGAAQAQQAEQGRKGQQGLKQQIEDTNSQAVEQQNAAAEAAAR